MANETSRIPLPEDMVALYPKMFDALYHEADAICAIVGTSYLEHAIRSLLRKHFVNGNSAKDLLDPVKGALSGLHTTATMSYCLGLISAPCKNNIGKIGSIRNHFAHSVNDASFDGTTVVDLCNQLTIPVANPYKDDPEAFATPRQRFINVTSLTCTSVLMAAIQTKHRESSGDIWGGK